MYTKKLKQDKIWIKKQQKNTLSHKKSISDVKENESHLVPWESIWQFFKAVPFMLNWGYWGSDPSLSDPFTQPKKVSINSVKNPATHWEQEACLQAHNSLIFESFQSKIRKPGNTNPPQVRFFPLGTHICGSLIECPLAQNKASRPHTMTMNHPTFEDHFKTFHLDLHKMKQLQRSNKRGGKQKERERWRKRERDREGDKERGSKQHKLLIQPCIRNMPLPPRIPHRLCLPFALPAG